MPSESPRLIASFTVHSPCGLELRQTFHSPCGLGLRQTSAIRQLTREQRARCVIEHAYGRRVAELLVDPRDALLALREVAELVRVGRDRGDEALLHEVARLLHLAAAVKSAERAEVDDERAVAAQLDREVV